MRGADGGGPTGRGGLEGAGAPPGTIVRDIGGADGADSADGVERAGEGALGVCIGAPAGTGAICVCIDALGAVVAIIVCACVPRGAVAIAVCACESSYCCGPGAAASVPGIVAASSVRADRGSLAPAVNAMPGVSPRRNAA